ncbi:low molecular weight protein tyrosine phosphatase family protein [Blastopirellula marina]|uniref:Phosphotyrosine protein phosphatase n=1 Tax=Blastopirellula marina TaxID=124 RepID=A0A2S8F6E3_9BACT|nr:phosphotyrosine protein phosphatase [Blastopirellula marina]PQO27725.1 phosphotyrosine protein phosphatase [Blastopirellula marina]PTL41464.1 phosphotyrosine protein phosphatase [Blastopirellula marina]
MPRWNVLFICSRNLWRSPTAERIYCDDARLSVRSRGLSPKAARRLSNNDLDWAHIIFVMEHEHLDRLRSQYRNYLSRRRVHVLDIPDEYPYMDSRLVELLQDRVEYFLTQIQEDHTMPAE